MINNSYLLGLYGYSTSGTGTATAGTTAATKKSQPSAPWYAASQPKQSDLLRTALSGRKFINESATQLDVKGKDSDDYRKVFAMYQGLTMLEAIANQGAKTNLSALERSQLTRRMEAGLAEMSSYLSTVKLDKVRLVEGKTETRLQTSAAVERSSSLYTTGVIHKGGVNDVVEAFQGDVSFGISIKRLNGDLTVNIDLAEMGSEPRTLDAVMAHINGKLQAAGVETRVGRQLIETEPRTLKVGDKTITLPAGADQWAMDVRGSSIETVQFVPTTSGDAVYVAQTNAKGGQELVKFQEGVTHNPTGQTFWVEGQIGRTSLPEGVEKVRASAVGPDGSVWMVADVTAGLTNQPIKGTQDVVLMKLDSAGNLQFSRALGAADTASGYAIAISDDGRVAVAGSVVGGLLPGGSVADSGLADSFVSVYSSNGTEQWTQRRGAKAADEATAVSFGADGQVYVAGRSQSAMTGNIARGGWDGYVQSFSEAQLHSLAPVISVSTGATQFGTSGDDSVDAMTLSGNTLYTAGVENGRLMVRSFQMNAGSAPTLLSSRDLGHMAAGEIAGLSVENGQVIVAGQTRNPGLNIAQVNQSHSGGSDAFVAVISEDLTASGTDRLTYFGGAGDDTASDVKIVDGKVWLTGAYDTPLGAKAEDPTRAYVARMDAVTGQIEWSQNWTAEGGQATTTTLAVSSGGASVLDRLGLPQGELSQSSSQRLVDVTSVRAGDRFYVTSASTGREVAVTIEAKDTLQSLATKIERASGRSLTVTLKTERDYVTGLAGEERITAGGVQRLQINYTSDRQGAILRAGESGRDALSGLGLTPGYVGPSTGETKTIGIDLAKTLNVRDPEASKTALEAIAQAMSALRNVYRSMDSSAAATTKATTGTVPAYLQNQIANYQAALARLTA